MREITKLKAGLVALLFVAVTMFTVMPKANAAVGVQGEHFSKIFYFSGPSGKGSATGLDAGNAKAIADTDIMSIPAGTVIEQVYVIVDTALTGTTQLAIGDDDSSTGYVGNSAVTLATPGIYGYSYKQKALFGASYLAVSTAGTSSGEIYVVPTAKYYSAAGKEIKLDNTTTNTGGAFRVVVEGFRLR